MAVAANGVNNNAEQAERKAMLCNNRHQPVMMFLVILSAFLVVLGAADFLMAAEPAQQTEVKEKMSDDIEGLCIPLNISDDEWKEKLTPEEYEILRKAKTERAFTSPLNQEKRAGVYQCAGCGKILFSSKTKYESGSGWPSFFQPVDDKALSYATDTILGYERKEVLCNQCGGHLGHVFNDGPPPTGKRFCMNGRALKFVPDQKQ